MVATEVGSADQLNDREGQHPEPAPGFTGP